MFKQRKARPQPRVREVDVEDTEEGNEGGEDGEEEPKIAIQDLLELRKFRQQRKGIDVEKLVKGDKKRRRRAEDEGEEEEEEEQQPKLKPTRQFGSTTELEDAEDPDAKARRAVRSNNFTQQTNALDVDKHMMAYIEENLKLRRGDINPKNASEESNNVDPEDDLFSVENKYKAQKKGSLPEGSVTNSMSMLTAIPEVDLGMDARLKNIEETEKAKRHVAEERQNRTPQIPTGEEHLVATRFYNPRLQQPSDDEALKNAKLEAMGLPPEQPRRHHHDRPQMATDDAVMERFKKRMRK